MADPKPAAKANPAPAPEGEHDLTLTQGQLDLLYQAVLLGRAEAIASIAKAASEIANPSLFNPQPELWEARKAAAEIALDGYNKLAVEFGNLLGIEPIQIVVIESATAGVTGPAEMNRPPSANPGSANSNQV